MNRKVQKPKLMAEINITPFTDVVLVLLIIFMIATPFIFQSSMKVQLPTASQSTESPKNIAIMINSKGDIFLDKDQCDLDTLRRKLLAESRTKPDTAVIINGDKDVKYDFIIRVLDAVVGAGFKNTGLGVELKKAAK